MATILSFRQKPREHFTGFILTRIKRSLAGEACTEVSIENHQQNASHGVHQCRVRLAGDPTVYRMILCPADAPVELYGRPVGDAFAQPLGDQ